MATYDFNVLVEDQSENLVSGATLTVYKSDNTSAGTGTTTASGVLAAAISLDTTDNVHLIEVTKTGYETVSRSYEIAYEDTSYYIKLPSYDTTYTTVDKVRRFMQLSQNAYQANTRVTDSTIADRINEAEDYMDKYCRRAWRSTTVTEKFGAYRRERDDELFNHCFLTYPDTYTLDSVSLDELNVWTENAWVDYLSTKTEGRANDFYQDNTKGIVYIKPDSYGERRISIKYRYGNVDVPNDIEKACILLATVSIVEFDQMSSNIPEGYQPSVSFMSKMERMDSEAKDILEKYKNTYYARL